MQPETGTEWSAFSTRLSPEFQSAIRGYLCTELRKTRSQRGMVSTLCWKFCQVSTPVRIRHPLALGIFPNKKIERYNGYKVLEKFVNDGLIELYTPEAGGKFSDDDKSIFK